MHIHIFGFQKSGIAPDNSECQSRHVVIRLTLIALTDPARARWQLAHECFHLLDPWFEKVNGRSAIWLEEGLATWFQNSRVPEAESHEGQYALAEQLVSPLMDTLPNAVRRIRQERGLRINEITPNVLQDYCPEMDEDTARKLCQPFDY